MARHAGHSKPESKPVQLYDRHGHKRTTLAKGIFRYFIFSKHQQQPLFTFFHLACFPLLIEWPSQNLDLISKQSEKIPKKRVESTWCNGQCTWLYVSEFELQSNFYLQINTLGKGMTLLYPSYGLNSISAVILQRMALALNNPQGWYTKEQNQSNHDAFTNITWIVKIELWVFNPRHLFSNHWLPSRLGLYNTSIALLQRSNPHPTSVLDMTLKNLMLR